MMHGSASVFGGNRCGHRTAAPLSFYTAVFLFCVNPEGFLLFVGDFPQSFILKNKIDTFCQLF